MNPISAINTPRIISFIEKPIMKKVKFCKRFNNLPEEEKEWFYENHKDNQNSKYLFYKATKLFVDEYNEQLQSRAKRKYEVALAQYDKQIELEKAFGFHAIKIKEASEIKSHCNKIYTTYLFSRPITQQEFISFLKEMGKKIISRLNWWDDYTIIKGNGNEWTYIHITPWLKPVDEECG